ncbi:TetR/AcrR family transcriptional regulator [Chromobacterium phragmitis]|uniref:TetR/AcrR family transcriptional regulator n=1 Tax=Chromobacterium phragmitis TaxID=2202141 RepID=A0A344UJW3_9NEIS|nr:TetR/AcrR family transcriptional regulator [Chromobacterium phragmitis]AXE30166.1 TetR/AcrR family transcriptional regulator [Chromobacterium phragmitis]AXE35561.1 TetR/AcrR family transcriptional regulator [Chromobacterium phragmitis]
MPDIPQPRKTPLQARSRHAVAAILEAAARILARDGYAAFNTNRVAEEAGVGIGSLYQYFPNKQALVAALHRRHGEETLAALDRALADTAGQPPRERLAAMVVAALDLHRRELGLHRVLEREWPAFDEPPASNPLDQALRERMEAWLAESGLDPAKAGTLLRMADSLTHGLLLDADPGAAGLEHTITDALAGFLGLPARPHT